MYQANITKETLNDLPLATYDGDIVIVDKQEKIEQAFAELNKATVVGIDTETKPSFKRGIRHKVALVQISTENKSFLFRLNKIGFPEALDTFLSDPKIKKIGLSLKDDFHSLRKQKTITPSNIVDIQTIAKEYGIQELSLQKIYAIVFGQKISKSQRLSNWENEILTPQQQKYAAMDAWATLTIYLQLQKTDKIKKSTTKKENNINV